MLDNATRGTPRSACPSLRSMMDPAAAYFDSQLAKQIADLTRTAAGRDYVLNDNGGFTRLDMEASAQGHLT